MSKHLLEPNTTFYPAAIVLVTSGGEQPGVMTCNRIASCSAEPPRLCISLRPARYTHALIQNTGEFVVNFPTPQQQALTDYLGVISGRNEDKLATAGLRLEPALKVKTPLLADCPVNIECLVEQAIDLGSHTMFIGLVQAVHAEANILDANGDVDPALAGGLAYTCGVVRERPVRPYSVKTLRHLVQEYQNIV